MTIFAMLLAAPSTLAAAGRTGAVEIGGGDGGSGGDTGGDDGANDGKDKPQCSDKIDNDGDGKVDYPDDPNCTGPKDNKESADGGGGGGGCRDFVDIVVVRNVAIDQSAAAVQLGRGVEVATLNLAAARLFVICA